MRLAFASLALAAAIFPALPLPALAVDLPGTLAAPESPEGLVGEAVLYFVGGRTREEAGDDAFNPFGMDADSVLFHVGAFFIVSSFEGEALKAGELALYPQYVMPRGEGTPGVDTPPIIPFALNRNGACYAGYVTGYPVPDATFALDLAGALCHADSVEQIVADAYRAAGPVTGDDTAPADDAEPDEQLIPDDPAITEDAAPFGAPPPLFDPAAPSDRQLQDIVYAAYNAAYERAVADPDYRFWDGSDFTPVRDAVIAALAGQGLSQVTVGLQPVGSPAEARACATGGRTELRIAFTPDGFGIAVAAASPGRVYAYEYDYAVSPDLQIVEPRDCATSGPGRVGPRSY